MPFRMRHLSFSLRTALVLMAVVCVALAFAGRRAQRLLAQKRAVQAIVAAGGYVTTDADDAVVDPFAAPDWKLAVGIARAPRVLEVYLMDNGDENQNPRDAVPHLAALPDLLKLDILDEWFDDACCEHLESLHHLEDLSIGSEGLTAKGFAHMLPPKLEYLAVSGADLRGLENRNLAWPTTLQCIALGDCRGLSGQAFVHMLGPALEWIEVDAGEFHDEQLLEAPGLVGLTSLSMTNCGYLTGRGIQPLLGPALKSLNLYGSNLSDADLRSLRFPPALEYLEVSSDRFTNASAATIVNACPQLRSLTLGGPLLDDGCVDALARLSQCRVVDLRGTPIGAATGAELSGKLDSNCKVVTRHGVYQGGRLVTAHGATRGGGPQSGASLQPPTAPDKHLDDSEPDSEDGELDESHSEPE